MLSFAKFFSKFGYVAKHEISSKIWVHAAKFGDFRSMVTYLRHQKRDFWVKSQLNRNLMVKFCEIWGEIWARFREMAKRNLGRSRAKDSIMPNYWAYFSDSDFAGNFET